MAPIAKRRRAFLIALVLTAFCLLAAGCAPDRTITVRDPFARPSPLVGGTGAAFMTIANGGRTADRLVRAESAAARSVELHETVDDGGVMRMVPRPEGWTIEPGGELELKPGGKHIMLMGLVAPLEPGQELELTLYFEQASPLTVTVTVGAM